MNYEQTPFDESTFSEFSEVPKGLEGLVFGVHGGQRFVNLTPHPINVLEKNEDGDDEYSTVFRIHPSGFEAIVTTDEVHREPIGKIPTVNSFRATTVPGMPPPVKNTWFITSAMAQSVLRKHLGRSDIISPGTGPTTGVRESSGPRKGQIKGTLAWSIEED